MVSLWITIALVMSATMVASLGAYFSIVGLGALFSGAVIAVWLMAGSLEFAKFTLAAYLHQTWKDQNVVYRSYLVFAVAVLSIITSVGVFGFLSEAYQSASTVLEAENIKIQNIKNEQKLIANEIARLNKSIDEIPANRISRKMAARAEMEPAIKELNKKFEAAEKILSDANLKILDVKKKVGPLVYIAKAFNKDIDTVVKYLILVFILVFDPLAICLVIAATHAIESKRSQIKTKNSTIVTPVKTVFEAEQPELFNMPNMASVTQETTESSESEDVIVQMNFKDENEDKKAV